MSIDYISQVKPLEDRGLTDAEIAHSIANQTLRAMPCYDSKLILEEQQLVREDPVSGQREGSLISHYQAMTDPVLKSLTGWYISHVFGRGENVNSHEYPRSSQVAMVMADLPAEMQPACDQLIALGGGKPFAGTVEADIVASRNQHAADLAEQQRQSEIIALQAEIENTWINPAISDGVSTADQVRASIKAGL
jgi:hypothetical protein